MKQIKTILSYVFNPKAIIFALAIIDFLYIYSKTIKTGTGISFCYICPWYETSTFIHLPMILLAALLLLISKKGSYLAAIALSGVIVVEGLIQCIFRMGLIEVWKGVQKYELNIFLQWEVQFIFATIIFSFAIYYLIRETTHKNILR